MPIFVKWIARQQTCRAIASNDLQYDRHVDFKAGFKFNQSRQTEPPRSVFFSVVLAEKIKSEFFFGSFHVIVINWNEENQNLNLIYFECMNRSLIELTVCFK